MRIEPVNVNEFTHRITLHVRGLRLLGIRFAIARAFFTMGAWIAGVNIVMEESDE